MATLSHAEDPLRNGAQLLFGPEGALARAVKARVVALARSQSLLTSVGPQGASLRDLIEQEVAPFAPQKGDNGQQLSIEARRRASQRSPRKH
jgi:two-component sensor histidine kinase